jgi:hypothetical protein
MVLASSLAAIQDIAGDYFQQNPEVGNYSSIFVSLPLSSAFGYPLRLVRDVEAWGGEKATLKLTSPCWNTTLFTPSS